MQKVLVILLLLFYTSPYAQPVAMYDSTKEFHFLGEDSLMYERIANTHTIEELCAELVNRTIENRDKLFKNNVYSLTGSNLDNYPNKMLYNSIVAMQKATKKVLLYYDEDNRLEYYNVSNQKIRNNVHTVAGIFLKNELREEDDGTIAFDRFITLESVIRRDYLKKACYSERFRDQYCLPIGTAFAVADSVFLTAAHCVPDGIDANDICLIFGYFMMNNGQPLIKFDKAAIYHPLEIKRFDKDKNLDCALIKVSSHIPDVKILKAKQENKIDNADTLYIVGHPMGLPLKIAGGAYVRDNSDNNHFYATLDAYCGNSGSPVFNSKTHVFEGMLIEGNRDFEYVEVNGCIRSICYRGTESKGEKVLRASAITKILNNDY